MRAYLRGFRRFADFRGRAGRPEFWLFVLIGAGVTTGLALADRLIDPDHFGLATLSALVHLAPQASVLVRRLHDADRTGWWAPAPIVPFSAAFAAALASPDPDGNDAADTGLDGDLGWLNGAILSGVLLAALLGLVVVALCCRRGTPGPNRFGPGRTPDAIAALFGDKG